MVTGSLSLETWETRVPLMAAGYHYDLVAKVDALRQTAAISPAPERVFYALRVTPFEAVRVVIVGQAPYHTRSGGWDGVLRAGRRQSAAVVAQHF